MSNDLPQTNQNNRSKAGVKFLFRALVSRNYRFYFFGLGISFIGSWMHRIALGWLAYRLTGSPMILGLVGFATMIPSFIAAPFAGVLSDKVDRHKVLMAVQLLAVVQTFILAFLIWADLITITQILVLGVMLGIVFGFDIPVRHSFIIEIINDRTHLNNAIALNSFLFNAARFIGPAMAGQLILLLGEESCIFLNGVSYLIFFFALLRIKTNAKPRSTAKGNNVFQDMREGFVYAYRNVPIRAILMILLVVSLFAMPYFILLPVFARDVLGSNAGTLGLLTAASGIGALVGVVYLGAKKDVSGLEATIPCSAVVMSISLIVFGLSSVLWLSMLCMVFVGAGMMIHMASCNTMLQTIVDDDKRGRVMSLYVMTFSGMAPCGHLFAGWVAGKIGAPLTVCGLGVVSLLGSIIYLLKRSSLHRLTMDYSAASN